MCKGKRAYCFFGTSACDCDGLLQKAASAKQANETATALENIQAEVAGSYGPDGKIDLDELNKNLKRVNGLKYNDADIVLDGENKNIIKVVKSFYGN